MAAITITAASVLKSNQGQALSGVAGGTITQGQAVYLDTSNNNAIKLADADAADPAFRFAGLSLNAASLGQPISYCALDPSFNLGATSPLTSGDVIYLAKTAGGVTATKADISGALAAVAIGVVNTDLTLNLNPTLGGAVA